MAQTIDLSRFHKAHRLYYRTALEEIKNGRKETHWMWFIFPQIDGLGHSDTTRYYAIKSLEEAKAYLDDPCLGGHLTEISQALLALKTRRASDVFPRPDDRKLRSSMTLFALAAGEGSVFGQVLDQYFHGQPDILTLDILNAQT